MMLKKGGVLQLQFQFFFSEKEISKKTAHRIPPKGNANVVGYVIVYYYRTIGKACGIGSK